MARTPLIAGNWKMNERAAGARVLATQVADAVRAGAPSCDVMLCPPFPYLMAVGASLGDGPVMLGAQDCHAAASGAHTGDVSAAMLADLGCQGVIVGHSERRADHGESDADVRAKAAAAHHAGLTAILCVGETLAQRDAGDTLAVVRGQVEGSLPESWTAANTVIAYEPVWAIGTGRVPGLEDIVAVHADIRSTLGTLAHESVAPATRILYGGSVNPGNAGEILALDEVDGALVGGASLKADSFMSIVEAAG